MAGGLQALLGAPMAAYSGCGEGDGGIGHGKRRSRTGSASLRGRWVGWQVSGGRAPSGWEWNGSQSGQGAAELLLPGPAPGKMQGQSACETAAPIKLRSVSRSGAPRELYPVLTSLLGCFCIALSRVTSERPPPPFSWRLLRRLRWLRQRPR